MLSRSQRDAGSGRFEEGDARSGLEWRAAAGIAQAVRCEPRHFGSLYDMPREKFRADIAGPLLSAHVNQCEADRSAFDGGEVSLRLLELMSLGEANPHEKLEESSSAG